MFGDRTYQLFRISGIRIGASPSWFLVLFLMIWWLSQYFQTILTVSDSSAFLVAVAATFLFFLSLLLAARDAVVSALPNVP